MFALLWQTKFWLFVLLHNLRNKSNGSVTPESNFVYFVYTKYVDIVYIVYIQIVLYFLS